MATQTVEFVAPAGQTITAKLFAGGSNTVVATATSVTEQSGETGVYHAAFTNVTAGLYRLIGTNAGGTLLCSWWVRTEAATGTYFAYETPDAGSWTQARAGYLDGVLIADNYNQRTVAVTGSHHVAADVHAFQPDVLTDAAIDGTAVTLLQAGLATSANQTTIIDRVSYGLTALVGACSDAQTAAETYTLSIGGNTFTVDYSGLDSSGNRSTTTLSKV